VKILYLHQYFCTPSGTGGVRSYEFARRWVEAGHQVEVVTGTGYDITLPDDQCVEIDGVTVRCIGVKYWTQMSFFRRLLSFALFAIKASWRACDAKGFDVVLATSTPLTIAIPALFAKWIARKPMIFEVRDVWPDAAIDVGQLKNPILIGMARLLELTVYRAADRIVPLSTGMQNRIMRKGVEKDKITMIPNCCDLDRFTGGARELYRAELSDKESFVILYVGAINVANHIEFLADAIDRLQIHSGWEWWFVGGGNQLSWLQEQAITRNWHGVRFWGPRAREDVADFTAAADCGVVSFIPQPVYYENSPNKFFDYIAASLPVVFSRTTWLQQVVEDYEAGFIGADGDVPLFVSKLLTLKDDISLRKRMGLNARRMAEELFSRDVMAKKYLKVFDQVLLNSGKN